MKISSGYARAVCLIGLWLSSSAWAAQYEVDINIETELDLYDLFERDQISEDTLETLVSLFDQGVDINTATREELYSLPGLTYDHVDAILLYRKNAGAIQDPADLVAAGALTPELLQQIAPFIVISERAGRPPVSGQLRAVTMYTHTDPVAPPAYLKGKLVAPLSMSGGFALMTTRKRLGQVSYDERRDALRALPPGYGFEIPKYYLRWRSSQRQIILGTFVGGFGERLTLDNTTRERPNGFYADNVVKEQPGSYRSFCNESAGELDRSPCADDGRAVNGTPDYSWKEGFRGIAASVENLGIGSTNVSLYGFGSYQTRSIYQYTVYDFGRCEDPRDDDSALCKAPAVYVQRDNPAEATSTFMRSTLPAIVDEATAGGHATVHLTDLTRIGLTGYYSSPSWNVEGMRLDFQEWSPYPFQGPFGAVGVDGASRFGPVNSSFELAYAMNSQPGPGGGLAFVQRNVLTPAKRQELAFSLRYFDKHYANPWTRPESAPDQFDGNRARNEMGARIEWLAKSLSDWRLRAKADLWSWPLDGGAPNTAGRTSADLSARADFEGFHFARFSGEVDYTNKDFRYNGTGLCYRDAAATQDINDAESEAIVDEPPPCAGERYRLYGRVEATPFGKLFVPAVSYVYEMMSTTRFSDRLGVNQSVLFEVKSRPFEQLDLYGRFRFRNYEVPIASVPPRYVSGMLQGTWRASRLLHLSGRYELFIPATTRGPEVFHRFRLELESRF